MEAYEKIAFTLKEHYEIDAEKIENISGGWSADVYIINTENNKYALKLYSKLRPSSKRWIEYIDVYIPMQKWLYDNTILKEYVPCPIFTKNHAYKYENEEYVYLLSEYKEGHIVGDNSLDNKQMKEIGQILGILHRNTDLIPKSLKEKIEHEKYQIAFCNELLSFINGESYNEDDFVRKILGNSIECVNESIRKLELLSERLKNKNSHFVLCHADAHNWNLIQGDKLILIDWECVRVAPPEQDLILMVNKNNTYQFFKEYKKYYPYTNADIEAYEYYYLKRRIEDVWECVKQLKIEGLVKSEETTLELLKNTLSDCKNSDKFIDNLNKQLENYI